MRIVPHLDVVPSFGQVHLLLDALKVRYHVHEERLKPLRVTRTDVEDNPRVLATGERYENVLPLHLLYCAVKCSKLHGSVLACLVPARCSLFGLRCNLGGTAHRRTLHLSRGTFFVPWRCFALPFSAFSWHLARLTNKRLESNRQQANLCHSLPSVVMSACVHHSGPPPPRWHNELYYIFLFRNCITYIDMHKRHLAGPGPE